jgi:hypothetical protein
VLGQDGDNRVCHWHIPGLPVLHRHEEQAFGQVLDLHVNVHDLAQEIQVTYPGDEHFSLPQAACRAEVGQGGETPWELVSDCFDLGRARRYRVGPGRGGAYTSPGETTDEPQLS